MLMSSYIQISASILCSCICYRIKVIIQTFFWKNRGDQKHRTWFTEHAAIESTRRDRKYLSVSNEFEDRLHECFTFFHMRYIQGYVINRIRAAGQAAVVRPFIRLAWQRKLKRRTNAQISFSTESSEHFMKERVHDKIFTGFVYCGVFFSQ